MYYVVRSVAVSASSSRVHWSVSKQFYAKIAPDPILTNDRQLGCLLERDAISNNNNIIIIISESLASTNAR